MSFVSFDKRFMSSIISVTQELSASSSGHNLRTVVFSVACHHARVTISPWHTNNQKDSTTQHRPYTHTLVSHHPATSRHCSCMGSLPLIDIAVAANRGVDGRYSEPVSQPPVQYAIPPSPDSCYFLSILRAAEFEAMERERVCV